MLCNNSDLKKLRKELRDTLNLSGLKNINPIFNSKFSLDTSDVNPNIDDPESISNLFIPKKNIFINFQDNKLRNISKRNCYWSVLPAEDSVAKLENKKNKFQTSWKYFLIKDTPIYIQLFVDAIKKVFKHCIVRFFDGLPTYFQISIGLSNDIKKIREVYLMINVLRHTGTIPGRPDSGIYQFVYNNKLPLSKALEKIRSPKSEVNYSFCLACGRKVDKNKKFCNSEKEYNASNKDNCLNTFNYWLKARLHIKTKEEREKKRQEFFCDLQKIVLIDPIFGFEEYKLKHPLLYTSRYKQRWERESNRSK